MGSSIRLLEREREKKALEQALAAAVAGEGALLVLEGEAGAGKTTLLEAACALAERNGVATLRARGGEFERDFPYGVIRQLFEPALAEPARRDRLLSGTAALAAPIFAPGEEEGEEFRLQHGLHWLLADLAAEAPLVLLVDDMQWADAASLRALNYLARRVDGLAVALVAAVRTGEESTDEGALAEIAREAGEAVLRPAPLTVEATGELVAERLGVAPDEGYSAACRQATGGNPLYLIELLRSLAEDGGAETKSAEHLVELAAAGLAPSILARVRRLGEPCARVAEAVAILEPGATARRVRALTGMEMAEVTAAAERLIGAQVLRDANPLAFVHPLLRAAVVGAMAAPGRGMAHARTARILAEDGAEADAVASHLLLSEPADDPWVVEVLRGAAATAQARGAPEASVRYLRRALREPPSAAERGAITHELGVALLRNGDAAGVAVLRELRAATASVERRAEIAIELVNSLSMRGGGEEAAELLEESLAEVEDRNGPLGMWLRTFALVQSACALERAPREPVLELDEPSGGTFHERLLLRMSSLLLSFGLGPISRAQAQAEAATAGGRKMVFEDSLQGSPSTSPGLALALADQSELGEELIELTVETAWRRTSMGTPLAYGMRACRQLIDGELGEAQASAQISLPPLQAAGLMVPVACYLGVALQAMIARGEIEEAESLLGEYPFEARGWPPGPPGGFLLCAVGELRRARDRYKEAREAFAAASERVGWLPYANAELFGWRGGLALCEAHLDNPERAEEIAAEDVALAREFGSPRALGVALRGHGLVADGSRQIGLLAESVEALEGTHARLQLARSLVELGAARRRAGRRREAREPLRRGMDLAHRCGAAPLEARARTELAATGARPRASVLSGVDSLTPSELRVARLAASGATNRQIAQQLFVTPKTVETHLRHVFQKLDLSGREELPAALAGEGEARR